MSSYTHFAVTKNSSSKYLLKRVKVEHYPWYFIYEDTPNMVPEPFADDEFFKAALSGEHYGWRIYPILMENPE